MKFTINNINIIFKLIYIKLLARTRFLHHKTSEILDKEDLEKLWTLLKDNISPPNDMKERINYRLINL